MKIIKLDTNKENWDNDSFLFTIPSFLIIVYRISFETSAKPNNLND